jgi:hypothetical protein
MRMLSFFDKYVELGLKPLPIYQNSKVPLTSKWNENWSIERWRPYFQIQEYNIGILLGDIIDVEGDSEQANDLLERMIDGCDRPKFRSSKSIHNLFINPDPSLTRFVCNGIEFRAHKHQSVLPPSSHNDGTSYQWLSGSKFPIPEMPEELVQFYFRNKIEKRKSNRTPPPKPVERNGIKNTICNKCQKKYPLHRKRILLEVQAFRKYNLLWMCRYCRPIDVRKDCRYLRKQT